MLFVSCNVNNDKIQTVALVAPIGFKGNIIIFFEQDTSIGDIRLMNGKHYFFVKNDGIFFTRLPIGNGSIENYIKSKDGLMRVYYKSPMTISQAEDTSYQVVGGSYRGITHSRIGKSDAKSIMFLSFRAGLAKDIKSNWELDDSIVNNIYLTKVTVSGSTGR